MLDIKLLRDDPEGIDQRLKTKVPDAEVAPVLELDSAIRTRKTQVEELKSERNAASKKIGDMKRAGEDTTELMAQVSGYGDKISVLDNEIRDLDAKYIDLIARLPNIPEEGSKVSPNVEDNVVLKEVGSKPSFDFPFKNHVELNETLNLFDFERGAKITGTGWPTYRGLGARLEWALLQYMLDCQVQNGFTQWMPPLVVREEQLYNSGQLPKFADQQYTFEDGGHKFCLIPTSEVALNGLHSDEILDEEVLPLRYCSYTPCFRREAGAAGSTERGMIRVHQFNKVEMFCFTKPEDSEAVFEQMLGCAETILDGLGIHYRSMKLVTGDMSFQASKTVDVEVWLPGQDRYYEVSSVSNCTDFQSRRSKTRFRRKGEKPELVHTLNGSGLATSRLMVGLLENNQNADGSVTIPEVLRPYLGGIERIEPQDAAVTG